MSKKHEDLIEIVESPGAWLRRQLAERQMSQASLARSLGIDPTQLNNQLSGRDAIPQTYPTEIGSILGLAKEEQEYFDNLIKIRFTAQAIERVLEAGISEEFPNTWNIILKRMITSVESAAIRDSFESTLVVPWVLSRYLADCLYAARCLARLYDDRFGMLMMETEDGIRHIRFPLNLIFGDLIGLSNTSSDQELEKLAQYILESLRETAKKPKGRSDIVDQPRQHAIHMLGRFGETQDLDIVSTARDHGDALTKRMAMYGQMFSGSRSDFAERFIFEMEKDEAFREAVIVFDSIHYGDTAVFKVFPKSADSLERTIKSILNSIIVRDDYQIIAVDIRKFLFILDHVDQEIFDNAITYSLARKARNKVARLEGDSENAKDFIRKVDLIISNLSNRSYAQGQKDDREDSD